MPSLTATARNMVRAIYSCSDLAEIVEVIFAVDPAMRRTFVETIGFVRHIAYVRTFAVEKHSLE